MNHLTTPEQERVVAGQEHAASEQEYADAASPSGCAVDPADRRFSSVSRVYGSKGRERLWQSHAVVIGIGGVGSWAAEALARSGVGTLTLIDLDHVAESNINRQVHALTSTLGAAKVEAMAARIRDISPDITLHLVDDFVEPGTEDALIPASADIVIDAIDAVAAKASLIAWCVASKKPVIVCGAAGGRTDPLQLRADDLARTTGDALLSAVRARLRQRHGFVRADGTVKAAVPDLPLHPVCPAKLMQLVQPVWLTQLAWLMQLVRPVRLVWLVVRHQRAWQVLHERHPWQCLLPVSRRHLTGRSASLTGRPALVSPPSTRPNR